MTPPTLYDSRTVDLATLAAHSIRGGQDPFRVILQAIQERCDALLHELRGTPVDDLFTAAELARRIGIRKRAASIRLRRLFRRGLLTLVDRGVYAVANRSDPRWSLVPLSTRNALRVPNAR